MVNKVILIGNLGHDPELRSTQGGQSVCTLRLATTDKYKDRDGNWVDRTEWHSVVVWGRQAETVNQYCRKGKQIFVEGRLQTRKWQDKEGKDRYSTEVVADNVRFLGSGGGGGEEGGRTGGSAPRSGGGGGYQGGGGGGGYQGGGGGGGYQGGGGGGGYPGGGGRDAGPPARDGGQAPDEGPPFPPADDDIPF